jgi:hypothetical protein
MNLKLIRGDVVVLHRPLCEVESVGDSAISSCVVVDYWLYRTM